MDGLEVPRPEGKRPKFDRSKMPTAPPASLEDFERLPPEIQDHLQRIATPAHVAMTVTESSSDAVKWKPAQHLMHINKKITEAALSPHQTFTDIEVSVRHGKATSLDTPVPTPSGWSTIGDLRVGDEVFDENGEVCRVVAKSPVFKDRPCFTVTTDDGDAIVADAEHEWPVSLSDSYHNRPPETATSCPLCEFSCDRPRGLSTHMGRKHNTSPIVLAGVGAERNYTTADLADRRQGHLAKGRSDRPRSAMRAVLKTDSPALPVDPWLLGFWLGDGTTVHGSVTIGAEDRDEVCVLIAAAGYEPSQRTAPTQFGVLGLQADLRRAGVLGDKHVPVVYLRASPVDRLALLQGLIDSDGHVTPTGQIEFCATKRCLADAVQELVRSLGYKASLIEGRATLNGRDCGPKWRVMFYMPDAARLERKRSRCIEPQRRDRFLTVEPTENHDTQCIEVDSPSHLFLCGRGMVPTHNSYLCSGYLPFWYHGWFPDRRVILLAYNEDKASEWGEFTRELMALWGPEMFGLTVDKGAASKTKWGIAGHRGEVIATGLGGTITGKGGDLVVIDDPIKNREDADSKKEREKLVSGYFSNVRTRLQGEGTVILAMARWREDDLAGSVVHGHGEAQGEIEELEDDEMDEWEVIRLPALAEAPKPPDDLTATEKVEWVADWRDELGRADGEPLWPEEWPAKRLRRTKATMVRKGESQAWYSLYQQSPTAKGGNEFLVDKWEIIPEVDRSRLRMVRWWDLAASEASGDFTVGALIGFDADSDMYVIDVQRRRLAVHRVEKMVKKMAKVDGITIPIRIEQEKAGAGKTVTANYKRLLVGHDVEGIPPVGDKETRATPYAGHQQAGRCFLIRGDWNADWIEEHRQFPKGRHDDQVDCGSGAFDFLAGMGPSTLEVDYQLSTPVAMLYEQRRQPKAAAGRGSVDARRAQLLRR